MITVKISDCSVNICCNDTFPLQVMKAQIDAFTCHISDQHLKALMAFILQIYIEIKRE